MRDIWFYRSCVLSVLLNWMCEHVNMWKRFDFVRSHSFFYFKLSESHICVMRWGCNTCASSISHRQVRKVISNETKWFLCASESCVVFGFLVWKHIICGKKKSLQHANNQLTHGAHIFHVLTLNIDWEIRCARTVRVYANHNIFRIFFSFVQSPGFAAAAAAAYTIECQDIFFSPLKYRRERSFIMRESIYRWPFREIGSSAFCAFEFRCERRVNWSFDSVHSLLWGGKNRLLLFFDVFFLFSLFCLAAWSQTKRKTRLPYVRNTWAINKWNDLLFVSIFAKRETKFHLTQNLFKVQSFLCSFFAVVFISLFYFILNFSVYVAIVNRK